MAIWGRFLWGVEVEIVEGATKVTMSPELWERLLERDRKEREHVEKEIREILNA
jgi:hypothetical protein